MKLSLPAAFVITTGLCLRLVVAALNSLNIEIPGAGLDAVSFHEAAVQLADGGEGPPFMIGWIYSYFLGLIYHLFGSSIFLGSLLSCIAWLISALTLYLILKLLDCGSKTIFYSLCIYSFLPSAVIFSSVTLREPYQLMFMNFTLYFFIKSIVSFKSSDVFFMIFSISLMGLLHGALLLFGLFTILVWFMITYKYSKSSFRKFIFSIFAVCSIVLFYVVFNQVSYGFDDLIDRIAAYNNSLLELDARSNYKYLLTNDNIISASSYIIFGFFGYLFEPLPWKAKSILDVLVVFENFLRLTIIFVSCRIFVNPIIRPPVAAQFLKIILILYFFVEGIWSVGTVNWGTAVRHHFPSLGFLLVAFAVGRNCQIAPKTFDDEIPADLRKINE